MTQDFPCSCVPVAIGHVKHLLNGTISFTDLLNVVVNYDDDDVDDADVDDDADADDI